MREFDSIFLDIEMDEMNGVEAGRKIRKEMNDYITQIIYVCDVDFNRFLSILGNAKYWNYKKPITQYSTYYNANSDDYVYIHVYFSFVKF